MKNYEISIHGCDDTTTFNMELSEQDAALIKRVCEKSEETSTYGCMPTLEIAEVTV